MFVIKSSIYYIIPKGQFSNKYEIIGKLGYTFKVYIIKIINKILA